MIEHPCPVVMVSSLTAEGAETTLQALRLGAVDFVAKPEGAISLHIDELTAELTSKVRAAAGAKLKSSARLKERIQHRLGGTASENPLRRPSKSETPIRATGAGLVLVGTSTGGPPALETLLTSLPADFPWPILVAQHMPASFTGALAQRLDRICALNVVEVTRQTLLQRGNVYIGRGDGDIVVGQRAAGLMASPARPKADYLWHPSTDRLVRSAMEHVDPARLVGILMTGMGNDGAEAMARLHAEGGRTIAEAEETAVVWGMPGELVAAKGADWILPLPDIASCLLKLVP
jgi:two-component system chemotaxis response regulator CheB